MHRVYTIYTNDLPTKLVRIILMDGDKYKKEKEIAQTLGNSLCNINLSCTIGTLSYQLKKQQQRDNTIKQKRA